MRYVWNKLDGNVEAFNTIESTPTTLSVVFEYAMYQEEPVELIIANEIIGDTELEVLNKAEELYKQKLRHISMLKAEL